MQKIKEKLAQGQLVRVFAAGRIMHPNFIQALGLQGGFDGVWLDHEHTGYAMEAFESANIAARAVGLESFVRIAPTDYAMVTRCFEGGAGGVMAAQINSAEQAEQFVRWSKFYPRGLRGLNTGGFDGRFGSLPAKEFCEKANKETFVAIQIETLQAVAEADGIAAIDGVDLLFVGPSDLSQAYGVIGDFMHPDCQAAIDKVAAACRKHGKQWGAVTPNPTHAEMLFEKGCRMLSPTNDVKLIGAGIAAVKQQFGKFFAM